VFARPQDANEYNQMLDSLTAMEQHLNAERDAMKQQLDAARATNPVR
jgi:hypothetical protein